MGNQWSQMFPPTAQFTENNLRDLHDKVYIITGATSGIGFELASMLYQAGATVYIGGRTTASATAAISRIGSTSSPSSSSTTTSAGVLKPFAIDLSDLTTIKPAVQEFISAESRLDVLFNNAGVSLIPPGSKSAQGFELTMATNCLGPYLLTKLLYPWLTTTATESLAASVRVVWTSSLYVEQSPPADGLLNLQHLEDPPSDPAVTYVNSKLGNWYLACEFARGIPFLWEWSTDERLPLHVALNPGNLRTSLLRHAPFILRILVQPLLYAARQGAYTALFAGLSEEVTVERNGSYIIPWGRFHDHLPEKMLRGVKREDEGGVGRAQEFVQWCEKMTEPYC
ncbi:MAG: hypothetical protein Q9162_000559 [Coniocarpon cinnabarinum]